MSVVETLRDLLRQEAVVAVGLLLCALAALLFVIIADEVMEEDTPRFDEQMLRGLRQRDDPERLVGPPWLATAARDVSALGSPTVLLVVSLSAVGFLGVLGKRHAMGLTVVATSGAGLLTHLLKAHYARPRPEIVPHLVPVASASFPSGHSMLAATVYLTLGVILARELSPLRVRVTVLSLAASLTALVGLSRVLLGVHYPTDVLAGWAAGLTWSLACWLVVRYLQQRGAIES